VGRQQRATMRTSIHNKNRGHGRSFRRTARISEEHAGGSSQLNTTFAGDHGERERTEESNRDPRAPMRAGTYGESR